MDGTDEFHWARYTKALATLGRIEEAEAGYLEALNIRGKHRHLIHLEYGELLRDEGRLDEAEKQVKFALEKSGWFVTQ